MPYRVEVGNPLVPEERRTESIGDAATEEEYDSPRRNALHNRPHRENGEPPHRQTKGKRKTGGLEDCTRLKGSRSLDDDSNRCQAPCAAKKAPAPRATKHAQRKWPQDAVAFPSVR